MTEDRVPMEAEKGKVYVQRDGAWVEVADTEMTPEDRQTLSELWVGPHP